MGVGKAKYRGVDLEPGGRYLAAVTVDGLIRRAGYWDDPREAAVAADRAALYFGLDGPLNLPHLSKRRGSASPEELRRLARMEQRRRTGTCLYLNVHLDGNGKTWRTRLHVDGARLQVTGFKSAEEAAVAHDRLARYYLGADAILNFPNRDCKAACLAELKAERHRARLEWKRTRYRGVCSDVNRGLRRPWKARIFAEPEGRDVSLGYWRTQRAAAIAYDRAALWYRGERAMLNFPGMRAKLEPADAETLRSESRTRSTWGTSSQYRGVSWNKRVGRWAAAIRIEGRKEHLGYFDSETKAARTYDIAARKRDGKDAVLNFARKARTADAATKPAQKKPAKGGTGKP